jgi:DNA (cytosine-5)-methyltransferase 1
MEKEDIKLLVIDLFCGAGGETTGIELARVNGKKCAKVIIAINHDKNAIESHSANHKHTLHFTEDIRTIAMNPIIEHLLKCKKEYSGAKILLHSSLECTNFSKAKGGQPRDADSRTLAEHLFRYIEAIDPDYIQIENVEEFMSWGDLDENGKPISKNNGTCYWKWVSNIKAYGYDYDYRILNAADYGAYTSRRRYFGVFAKLGLPIIFPNPTHSKTGSKDMFGSFQKWKPVKECLNFSDEGESIFDRKKDLVEASLDRILSGLVKFVAGGKDKFIQQRNSGNPKSRILDIESPARTLTCTGGNMELVQTSFISKYYSGQPDSKNSSIEEPAGTVTTKDHHSLINTKFLMAYYGNGHNHSLLQPSPVIRTKDTLAYVNPKFVMNNYSGGGKVSGIDKPCPAVTTTPKQNLVQCHFIDQQFGNVGSSIHEPAPVITANRKWHYLMNPQFSSKGGSVDAPCFTLIARMDKMPPYLIEATNEPKEIPSFIKIFSDAIVYEIYETDSTKTKEIKEFMAMYGILDIKMRMLRIPELKMIMGFPKDYKLIGTQADQKKFIGNAVEVTMAKVLCEAIVYKLNELKLVA